MCNNENASIRMHNRGKLQSCWHRSHTIWNAFTIHERKTVEKTFKMSHVTCKGNMWNNNGANRPKNSKRHLDIKALSVTPAYSSMNKSMTFVRISEVPSYSLCVCVHAHVYLYALTCLCILFLKELQGLYFRETPKNEPWYHGNGPKEQYYLKWVWFTRRQKKKKKSTTQKHHAKIIILKSKAWL